MAGMLLFPPLLVASLVKAPTSPYRGRRPSIDPRVAPPGCTVSPVPRRRPSIISGMSEVAAEYDVILLDQFGVLHDGERALPGAVECFEALAASGKQLVVLSNTSRRRSFALKKLPSLGFRSEHLTDFVCSGEQAWQHIKGCRKGQRMLWIAWGEGFQAWEPDFLDGLEVTLAPASEADFVFCHGSMTLRDGSSTTPTDMLETGKPSDALREALHICAVRNLTMVCANPDLYVVLPSGERGYMPGIIAKMYEELGGRIVYFGKPYASAFQASLESLGRPVPLTRVLHVGDSLDHDIKGANQAGVHSLFVAGGIHASELKIRNAGNDLITQMAEDAVQSICDEYGVSPTYTISSFVWEV